jgi:hypothetical protein
MDRINKICSKNCLFFNFVTFFQEWVSGLADLQDFGGLAISGLENFKN